MKDQNSYTPREVAFMLLELSHARDRIESTIIHPSRENKLLSAAFSLQSQIPGNILDIHISHRPGYRFKTKDGVEIDARDLREYIAFLQEDVGGFGL